ncbi:MAG: N-acetyl-gamma-glutamyl-phosphate reductase [Alistipes sp.]|jgi:N-acetyl-gamma-glutamyl-phosphate reductase|nr:N-acetyl-gamma-glutamyl-phosphate reductase [Alistipes sp.]MBQ5785425.1 N-acetyl-gamma-glutamyl-phosphate reductase [Alistipes sp.]
MIRVGIAGAAGYTAGELIRLLVNHPHVELKYAQSGSHKGEPIHSVHSDMIYLDMTFQDIDFESIDLLFICMGHGNSAKFLAENPVPERVKIIDLSNDFRLKADAGEFVYGAPELNREQIKGSRAVANPGCFATSINLALMPLAKAGILPEEVNVVGITGSTGAGQKPTQDTHFSNRNSNLSNYKVFTHQHLGEIGETLVAAGAHEGTDIAFVPVRGCHTRGIMSDVVVRLDESLEEIVEIYKSYYAAHPFVCVSDKPVYMKQVVNTNYCFLSLQKEGRKLLITSVVDNLLKGASGQAVQNMNLMFGLDEMEGLRLKANYF